MTTLLRLRLRCRLRLRRLLSTAALATLATAALASTPPASLAQTAAPATAPTAPATTPARPLPGVKHVLLIGLDGFGSYAWEKAAMPNLKTLAASGASTLKARPIMPVISGPNWGAHLTGAGPESHGYLGNGAKPSLPPAVLSKYGRFPGIFGLVRDAYPNAETGAIYDWARIHELIEDKAVTYERIVYQSRSSRRLPAHVSVGIYEESTARTSVDAANYIATKKPFFTFVYFGAPDETGHHIGHDTPAYYATLKKCDDHIGQLLGALKTAGIEKETIVIVVSDHGGLGKGHGEGTMQGMQTPWIIAGPGVKRGHTLVPGIVHYDTTPTIAHILGISPPPTFRGRPALDAFAAKNKN